MREAYEKMGMYIKSLQYEKEDFQIESVVDVIAHFDEIIEINQRILIKYKYIRGLGRFLEYDSILNEKIKAHKTVKYYSLCKDILECFLMSVYIKR
jgi:2,3-bisphosphoglycerate-independent phosphoglycerate mutase